MQMNYDPPACHVSHSQLQRFIILHHHTENYRIFRIVTMLLYTSQIPDLKISFVHLQGLLPSIFSGTKNKCCQNRTRLKQSRVRHVLIAQNCKTMSLCRLRSCKIQNIYRENQQLIRKVKLRTPKQTKMAVSSYKPSNCLVGRLLSWNQLHK